MELLDTVYQDEYLVVINKPSGLLVHKSPIDKHETRFAMAILRDQIGQWVYPVHRLDKPTSGLLIFALDKEVAAELGEQFQQKSIEKTYEAVVRGYVDKNRIIDHPLKEPAPFKHQKEEYESRSAQEAITQLEPLSNFELPVSDGRFATSRYAHIRLRPETGRRHQLRKHMKHVSHPIIGDVKYGKGQHNRLFEEWFGARRLMLASRAAKFRHPNTGKELEVSAPLTEDFQSVLLGLERYKIQIA